MKLAILPLLSLFLFPAVSQADDLACAACHAEIYKSYQSHPMARTSGLVDAQTVPVRATDSFLSGDLSYQVLREGSGIGIKETQGDLSSVQHLTYFVGAGLIGRSFLYQIDQFLFQSPLAYYAATQKWGLSPGFEQLAGTPVTRPVDSRCLNCHASKVQKKPETTNEYRDPPIQAGVSCERCHGAADDHLARVRSGRVQGGLGIVNPAKLLPAERDSVCAQCHLMGAIRVSRIAGGEPYRPGARFFDTTAVFLSADGAHATQANSHFEQLSQSACWRKSAGALWCGTCHDPHKTVPEPERVNFYRNRCNACHSSGNARCIASPAARQQEADNCLACHMPSKPINTVAHAAQTDHTIRRIPATRSNAEPNPGQLLPFPGTTPGGRDFGLAYAALALERRDPDLAKRASGMLQEVVETEPHDIPAADQLAQLYDSLGQHVQACRLFEKIALQDTAPSGALVNAGGCVAEAGDLSRAISFWQRALRLNPSNVSAALNSAVAQYRTGDVEAAKATVQAALRFNPLSSKAMKILQALK